MTPSAPTAADTVYVGIDVSGDRLDVARNDSSQSWSFTNDEKGIAELILLIAPWNPGRIAVESTGKIERPLLTALIDASLNACHVNPGRVRKFADGMGWLAKTDAIDARVLALFSEKAGPRIATKCPEKRAEIAELVVCRRQLVSARVAHKNQLKHTVSVFARKRLEGLVEHIKKQIDAIEERIEQLIDSDDDMRHLDRILQSVAGVGAILSATLISKLREIGQLDHRPLSALVGLAPYAKDSGKYKGQRAIRGGRACVRNVLYVCTIAAIRHNPVLKQKYLDLRARHKLPKVAIIACARKLLRILNALVRDNAIWQPPKPKTA